MTFFAQTFSKKQALFVRLMTGLVLGLVMATLDSLLSKGPTSTEIATPNDIIQGGFVFWAAIIWAGAGTMRRGSLIVWALISFALIFFVTQLEFYFLDVEQSIFDERFLLMIPFLFMTHELVSSSDIAGNWIAPYKTYFEEAWKRGAQLGLAILFISLFVGILMLGQELLGFIGFQWLEKLFENGYFILPLVGVAFGAAVHLADLQNKLLTNMRALVLGVLSWLLPVITLIGAIFAASLIVSGLAPLWATKAATTTLLSVCAGFVLLINAAYQQGDVERQVSPVLKWSARGAAILLLIFAVLAAWSLSLRIGQYGLSPIRVFACLGVVLALAFGVGYSAAVVVPGRWMAAIEPVNVYLTIFNCVLLFTLLTPIGSPDRLSVTNQVERLNAGKVSVDNFDWWLLHDQTSSYGTKALAKLTTSQNAKIAAKAKAVQENKLGPTPYYRGLDVANVRAATRADIAALPVVFPKGARLPDSFLNIDLKERDNSPADWVDCLSFAAINPALGNNVAPCKFALLDLSGDGTAEVLLHSQASVLVFAERNGTWRYVASIAIDGLDAAFDSGNLRGAPAKWNDLIIGGARRDVEPSPSDED